MNCVRAPPSARSRVMSNYPEGPLHFEGSLSFQSLVCELFNNDVGDNPVEFAEANHLSEAFRINVKFNTMICKDTYAFPLGIEVSLSEQSQKKVFHERCHYWQVLTSGIFQYRFLLYLDKLKAVVASKGGSASSICGIDDNVEEELFQGQDITAGVLDATLYDFSEVRPVGPEALVVSKSPLTALWEVRVPARYRIGPSVAAWHVGLGFSDPGKVEVVFPLTGRHLIESAAYVSELQYSDADIPEVRDLVQKGDQLYLGAWEVWRRTQADKYTNRTDLIVSFLAAVDLALMGDLADPRWLNDPAYRDQMCSMPMRFGYIVIHAGALPPLSVQGGRYDLAVAEFQDRISLRADWPTRESVLKKYSVLLTRTIFKTCVGDMDPGPRHVEVAQWLMGADLTEASVERNFGRLEDAWQLIRDYDSKVWSAYVSGGINKTTMFLGKAILQTMLNATVYRLNNPGKMAVPHVYKDELIDTLPLPIALVDGNYSPIDFHSSGLNKPLGDSRLSIIEDCITLITLAPLERLNHRCGFLQSNANCAYVLYGLGCPFNGLTEKEQQLRAEAGCEDWCHFTYNNLRFGIAPDDVTRRWMKRLHHAAPPGGQKKGT
ncbi:MAG: hypothetical protein P4L84_19380 [Isosphaeraceae bacterium]|nr:hypothetical protein [Isosphaeraceae bacterium]